MKVIGQYRCGCSYGPVKKSGRLEYCSVHGEDIQDEYPFLDEKLAARFKSEEKTINE